MADPITTTPSGVRFLLVEDDPDHADLFRRSMARRDSSSEFRHVSDGEAALALLRRDAPYADEPRPDVVILDLKLPRLSGHDVLRTIKSDPDLASIPVVVLTTSLAVIDREDAYRAHVNSYVTKPDCFDQFEAMVVDLDRYWTTVNRPPPIADAVGASG